MEQMILRAKRIRAAAAEAIAEALRGSLLPTAVISGFISALLAVYSPAEESAPFGTGCAIGVWYAGVSPYFALAGAFAVYLLRGGYAHAAACAVLAGAILFAERIRSVRRIYRLLIGFGAEAAMLCLSAAVRGGSGLMALGASSVSILIAVITGHAVNALGLLSSREDIADTELLSLAAAAGLITLSLGNVSALGVSPAMLFAGVCAMVTAYRFGLSSVAFVVAVGAGRAMASDGDLHFMAIVAISALISATLGGLGKWAVAAGFAFINVMFAAFVRGTGLFSAAETLISAALFLLIPSKLYKPNSFFADRAAERSSDAGYPRLQVRISGLAEVLSELARVFGGESGSMLYCISDTLRRTVGSNTGSRGEKYAFSGGSAACAGVGGRSGDNCCIRRIGGSVLMCISDGMGSGDEAWAESREALAMLSDLISVGFDMRSAAACVNRLLIKRAESEMYATLDAVLIDLSDCSAQVLKLGAPPSYVLRGGRLFSIYTENLPVGIIAEAEPPVKLTELKRGDVIVMMSDGAADALGGELKALICEILEKTSDCDTASREILAAAKERGGTDDMTVLTARIS